MTIKGNCMFQFQLFFNVLRVDEVHSVLSALFCIQIFFHHLLLISFLIHDFAWAVQKSWFSMHVLLSLYSLQEVLFVK